MTAVNAQEIIAGCAHQPDRYGEPSLLGRASFRGDTDLDGSQPEAWRYVTEVQDAGKPANVTGYR